MRIEKKLKINYLFNDKTEKNEATEFLYQFLNDNLREIHDLLFGYHYTKRERVYDIFIHKNLINYNNLQGDFTAEYMIGLSNACADVDYNTSAKMKIDFSIDNQNNILLLKGEDIPEQEQYEI